MKPHYAIGCGITNTDLVCAWALYGDPAMPDVHDTFTEETARELGQFNNEIFDDAMKTATADATEDA
jgi:hypothetical protein